MINTYGILISFAIFVSLAVSLLLAKKEGKNTEIIWDGAIWAIFFGVVGARLYHVFDYFTVYIKDPITILYIWNGGLGVIGGLLGGGLGLYAFLKKNGYKIRFWLDLAVISIPLAQAIGRLGNFFNKENFGGPTSLPWGQYIETHLRPDRFKSFEYFHPTYFYEAVLNLFLFGLLYSLYSSKKVVLGSGKLFYYYLFGYSVIRFFLEFMRINTWTIGVLNIAQVISILVMLFSSYKLFIKK